MVESSVYSLRPHQAKCVEDIWQYFTSASGDPVAVQPTGAGKSIIVAEVARQLADVGRRLVVLAPKKELITQNVEKMLALSPSADVGIYCAGLNRRDTDSQVVFGTIQSVYRRPLEFGFRHLCVIDECHTIQRGEDGMYNQFFDGLRQTNPKMRKLGLTATPYRLDSGLIYGEDEPFDDVCHATGIPELLANGYISPVVSASVRTVSMEGVRVIAGEFDKSGMSAAFGRNVVEACTEAVAVANAQQRRHCLVFAVSVAHCEQIASAITAITGEDVRVITGDTPPLTRQANLEDFRSGAVRWLVNCEVLTTGFDAPDIDLIAVMRSTMSPGLFYQICGRGFRLAAGKEDCALLDFGGNLARHGALDSEDYGKEALKKKNGEAMAGECPMKECPSCKNMIPVQCKICPECIFRFEEEEEANHESQADAFSPALECGHGGSGGKDLPRSMRVTKVMYSVHQKRGASKTDPRTLRVDIECHEIDSKGDRVDAMNDCVTEWICLEHSGWARSKAVAWWNRRSSNQCPNNCDDAVEIASAGGLASPITIDIEMDGDWPRIVAVTSMSPKPSPVRIVRAIQDELPF